MAELNCYNCGVDISKYENYLDSPCAKCKLANEYYKLPKAVFFLSADESGDDDDDCDSRDVFDSQAAPEVADRVVDICGEEGSRSLKAMREAVEQQVMVSMSGLVIRLLQMSKENPIMFEVTIKKMQFPHMSYSEIGQSMTPVITKQIVLYNLKKAIETIPELGAVFLTDTRFSSGKMALTTVAEKNRRDIAIERLKGVLYGDDPSLKSMALKEVNAILSAPCILSDGVLDFNWYSEDADKLRLERLRAKNMEKKSYEGKNGNNCKS